MVSLRLTLNCLLKKYDIIWQNGIVVMPGNICDKLPSDKEKKSG